MLTPDSYVRMTAAIRSIHDGVVGGSEVELEFVRPDGSHGWILSSAVPLHDANGLVCAARGTALDITVRKRAELAFAELSERTERRERMLSVLLSSMNDFAYIFDRDGRFLFANQRLLDLLDGVSLSFAN
jgi:PAS domain-containing protein